VETSSRLGTDAAAGRLPRLSYFWHGAGTDEHPPSSPTDGMRGRLAGRRRRRPGWSMARHSISSHWDDWGGFDDHDKTPVVEYTPDNVQLAYGPRVPLLMLGGYVKPGIDSRWCSHVSVPKTVLQLLGVPKIGLPRVDNDHGLVGLVDTTKTPTRRHPVSRSRSAFRPRSTTNDW
jgi:hypothetical protein